MSKLYEVLAPAGSVEQLISAVNNGCDCVYLGLDSFNARMKAPNFTSENLRQWVDYCHLFGVKVFVAVNTSIKNNEFERAWQTVLTAYNNLADGVIVTDLALMKLASQLPPPFDIVASTQLNIHDKYGAEFVKRLGATTVVCARECSLQDIRDIKSTGVKVEAFLHGALCVCQSGQCLFSSIVGGNSGNRGLCAQPCRKLYAANDSTEYRYLLSPKDFCGAKIMESMIDAGVSVFKIEGRNRRPEYAGLTSAVYSRLIENELQYSNDDDIRLKTMYNRGDYTYQGYLHSTNSDIIYPYQQNHIGIVCGQITRKGFWSDIPLKQGDGLKVLQDNREYCGGIVRQSGSGIVEADFSKPVKAGMTVCLTTSTVLNELVNSAQRRRKVKLHLDAFAGKRAVITASCDNTSVSFTSDYLVEKSKNAPTDLLQITQQLSKNSNSNYTITDITADFDNIFLAKSQLNALRRVVLDKLTEALLSEYNSQFSNRIQGSVKLPSIRSTAANPCVCAIFTDADSLIEHHSSVDISIFKPTAIDSKAFSKLDDIFCYVDLPSFCNLQYLEGLNLINKGIVCHNLGQVQFARENNIKYIAGSGLNIFNDYIANIFDDCITFVYSHELSFAEINAFATKTGVSFVDGELTLMKLIHCPFKVATGCDCNSCKANDKLVYTDELGNKFVIKRRKDKACSFELINGNKLSVVAKQKSAGRYLMDFDKSVVNHYKKLNEGADDGYVERCSYTKGRLYTKIN